MEWVALIQNTAFPIVACIALAVFIHNTIQDNRATLVSINEANNAARVADREAFSTFLKGIDETVKENTSATYELAKAVGELSVRMQVHHDNTVGKRGG